MSKLRETARSGGDAIAGLMNSPQRTPYVLIGALRVFTDVFDKSASICQRVCTQHSCISSTPSPLSHAVCGAGEKQQMLLFLAFYGPHRLHDQRL